MTATLKLYDTVEALNQVAAWLEETDGELTPELEALMEEASGDFGEKVERVAAKITEFKATAKAQAEEAARVTARANASKSAADRLANYLERCLVNAGTEKVVGLKFTVALQQTPPAVEVDSVLLDEAQLRAIYTEQPEFVRRSPETFALDKRAVIDASKLGRPLPSGCSIVTRKTLRIR